MKVKQFLLISICLFLFASLNGQDNSKEKDDQSALQSLNLSGLKMRNIGPAFASGRIADIAIHPQDDNVWYIAVGSGGVWKTENAGVTWSSIFDSAKSYSTGCVTIDPSNNHTIWVGTGENVGGRHVGFGDGVYKSEDDGRSWKNMGLKASEHISKIIVHPENSDVIYVAAQGPLWNSGGERGLYLSEDGGETWTQVLGNDEWTGVTDVVMDPRNPDVMYAATWDRHRTVAAYMGGGPGSGIHRSMDGGKTWQALKKGIPGSNLGKIGLAINPFNPDMIYAAIETDRTTGGVYVSENMGMSWSKQSNAVSGATGPHYYQELYASPHHEGTLYLMDNRVQVSTDHGKTFERLSERGKHSDNHAIAFRDDDPDYILMGTDGGLYESFDMASHWRFIDNMPITQYYKVAVDDSEPFYWVYGGTQDNGSHGGPSRTDTEHGIRNADWIKTLGADGHQSATEPGNPNIMYAETQQGGMHRVDRITGEQVYIQPQAMPGEPQERFNWDAPILVSAHDPATIYFASYRVWKSTDRGDSWTAISGDLTRNEDRMNLPIMGRIQSWENPWDLKAMSQYNTITSLGESPLKEGLIYAGTDDGIVQSSEDDGNTWTKVDFSSVKDMPERPFVNDIRADLHDENTVYLCMDNHKSGDFKPYLLKSTDKGKSWKSITGNLPETLLIWRIVQDHVNPNLLFIATEYGIYFTLDGGEEWIKLKSGIPNIAFRDITIQRRENDLVGASFGRSFFVLDDISPLRILNEELLDKEAALFPVKDAYWFEPRSIESSQGSANYAGENPPVGAVFTYYLKDEYPTLKGERLKAETEFNKKKEDVPFPGWEALNEERNEEEPQLLFTIKDMEGNIVNIIETKPKKGINRISWDMRALSKNGIRLGQSGGGWRSRGFLVPPGKYSVSLSKKIDGVISPLSEAQEFELIPLREGAVKGLSKAEIASFKATYTEMMEDVNATNITFDNVGQLISSMENASMKVDENMEEIVKAVYDIKQKYTALKFDMEGDPAKDEIGESYPSSPMAAIFMGYRGLNSTYGPTPHHIKTVNAGYEAFQEIKAEVNQLIEEVTDLEQKLIASGAPWIEGQGIKE